MGCFDADTGAAFKRAGRFAVYLSAADPWQCHFGTVSGRTLDVGAYYWPVFRYLLVAAGLDPALLGSDGFDPWGYNGITIRIVSLLAQLADTLCLLAIAYIGGNKSSLGACQMPMVLGKNAPYAK